MRNAPSRALAVLASFLAATTAPALAQADLKSRFDAANQIFTAGAANIEEYTQKTHSRLIEGLDGTWFSIWMLGPDATPEDYAAACERLPITVAVRDPFTVTFDQAYDGGSLMTTYSARGGNAFGSHTDPASLVKRYALDMPEAPPGALASALNGVNGIATIARPSPDILVVQTNYSVPQIYARCPG